MRFFQLFFICFLFNCSARKEEKLTIATAANVQFAMEELVEEFKIATGIDCEIVLGSSGQLATQIKAGAPFDVFVSANMEYPDDLFREGLTAGPPKVYSYGVLVLWTTRADHKNLSAGILIPPDFLPNTVFGRTKNRLLHNIIPRPLK